MEINIISKYRLFFGSRVILLFFSRVVVWFRVRDLEAMIEIGVGEGGKFTELF